MVVDIVMLATVGVFAAIAAGLDLRGTFEGRQIPHVSLFGNRHAVLFLLVNAAISIGLLAWVLFDAASPINDLLGGSPALVTQVCAVGFGVPLLLRSKLFTVEKYPVGPAIAYDSFRIHVLLNVSLASYKAREALARSFALRLGGLTLERCDVFLDGLIHLDTRRRAEARKGLEAIFLIEEPQRRGERLVVWVAGLVGLTAARAMLDELARVAPGSAAGAMEMIA
jgi:hypothetical protein